MSGVSRPAGWPKMRLGTPQGAMFAKLVQGGDGGDGAGEDWTGYPAPAAANALPVPAYVDANTMIRKIYRDSSAAGGMHTHEMIFFAIPRGRHVVIQGFLQWKKLSSSSPSPPYDEIAPYP